LLSVEYIEIQNRVLIPYRVAYSKVIFINKIELLILKFIEKKYENFDLKVLAQILIVL
jgi:hypothetical protein